MPLVQDFRHLRVFTAGFEAAMRLFELSKHWPIEERYSLTDQIRRSSRSVCSNIAEAWRKRLYVASFVSKLSDSNAEAAETQVWLKFARECNYIDQATYAELDQIYHKVSGGLVRMIAEADAWCGPAALHEPRGTYDVDANGFYDPPPEG